MGVPAFAITLETGPFTAANFESAARFAAILAEEVLRRGLPSDTFLNVNIPTGTPRGVRLTRQGKRMYGDVVVENVDPRGRKYYWLGGGELGFQNVEGTDFHAVHDQYISVTPLHIDLTNYRSFDDLTAWSLEKMGNSLMKQGGEE
jgi:5'-nucleotidase